MGKVSVVEVVGQLLQSEEPSVRFKVLTNVLGVGRGSRAVAKLRESIRSSQRVRSLLSERGRDGKIPIGVYSKWRGSHWVLASLADIGYPRGDEGFVPLREQVYEWLFSSKHGTKIKCINNRFRRCASQEGNALYYLLALGLADERTDELAERLIRWQWPDGGWNCDKNAEARNSSFMESLIPLRGLSFHAQITGSGASRAAAQRASEVFLKRKLFRRQRDGGVIRDEFLYLHYPCYWHYDVLFGLKVMAEAGCIRDKRCSEALDVLEAKWLPDGGGFPAERKYYQVTHRRVSGRSLVDWGGTGKRRMNEFVTADALYVLKESGRLPLDAGSVRGLAQRQRAAIGKRRARGGEGPAGRGVSERRRASALPSS